MGNLDAVPDLHRDRQDRCVDYLPAADVEQDHEGQERGELLHTALGDKGGNSEERPEERLT